MFTNNEFSAISDLSTTQKIMVDLHGLSPKRSQEKVNLHLSIAELTRTKDFRFVTGKGNHVNAKGERGTLFREFPNWLSEENLEKIESIKKCDGYYEISMKSMKDPPPFDLLSKQLTYHWLVSNIDFIKKQAEKGEALYQYLLGNCCKDGIVFEKDEKKAFEWYERAAKQKDAFALYELGGCYWQGRGVRQNDEKAIELFHAAAEQNFVWAFHQLGDIYCYGFGIKQDLRLARDNYESASQLGLNLAKRKLGHIYFYGEGIVVGIQKDETKGFLLYKEAADSGDAHSAYNVACAYLNGTGVTKNEKLAFQYGKKAADQGDPDAQFFTAICYSLGRGVAQNQEVSFDYLVRSANNNFKHALFQLAFHPKTSSREQYYQYLIKAAKAGQIIAEAIVLMGISQDKISADERNQISRNFWEQEYEEFFDIPTGEFKWLVMDAYLFNCSTKKQIKKSMYLLNQLVELNDPQVLGRLGYLYKIGEKVKKDVEKAEQYWLKGAVLKDSHCLCALGYLYEERGNKDNSACKKAFQYHEQAAKLGNANSYNQLGLLYKEGNGVEKNIDKAIECFNEALRLDSPELRFIQRDGLFYRPVFPHAAYNLAVLYWYGEDGFPSFKELACYWFMESAKAGSEEAAKAIQAFKITCSNPVKSEALNHSSFWEITQKSVRSEAENTFERLNEITSILGLNVSWKISKQNQAWCYIEPSDISKIPDSLPESLALRKTKNNAYILLVEKLSMDVLLEIIKSIDHAAKKEYKII